jgi:hypothetical protein
MGTILRAASVHPQVRVSRRANTKDWGGWQTEKRLADGPFPHRDRSNVWLSFHKLRNELGKFSATTILFWVIRDRSCCTRMSSQSCSSKAGRRGSISKSKTAGRLVRDSKGGSILKIKPDTLPPALSEKFSSLISKFRRGLTNG